MNETDSPVDFEREVSGSVDDVAYVKELGRLFYISGLMTRRRAV